MVLEQFKNTVSSCVTIYINEHNVETSEEVVKLADDFVLTHKSTFVDVHVHDVQSATSVKSPSLK